MRLSASDDSAEKLQGSTVVTTQPIASCAAGTCQHAASTSPLFIRSLFHKIPCFLFFIAFLRNLLPF
jgi:hypothetical protein